MHRARKTCQTDVEKANSNHAVKKGILFNCIALFLPIACVTAPESKHPTGTQIRLTDPARTHCAVATLAMNYFLITYPGDLFWIKGKTVGCVTVYETGD